MRELRSEDLDRLEEISKENRHLLFVVTPTGIVVIPSGDWRKHTCVECGYWTHRVKLNDTFGTGAMCRKYKYRNGKAQACPDFIPRETSE